MNSLFPLNQFLSSTLFPENASELEQPARQLHHHQRSKCWCATSRNRVGSNHCCNKFGQCQKKGGLLWNSVVAVSTQKMTVFVPVERRCGGKQGKASLSGKETTMVSNAVSTTPTFIRVAAMDFSMLDFCSTKGEWKVLQRALGPLQL